MYFCQMWRHNGTIVRKILQLQNKAMRITNFKPNDYPADVLYHSNKLFKNYGPH